MGNLEAVHKLMIAATMPSCTVHLFQQALAFRFFTLLITNLESVWILFIQKDGLVDPLRKAGTGEQSASIMRDSARQFLRQDSIHVFVNEAQLMFLNIAINPEPKRKDELLGAESPERK